MHLVGLIREACDCNCTLHISCPVWVPFSAEYPCVMALSKRKFHENRRCERHNMPGGLTEFLAIISTFIVQSGVTAR